MSLVRFAVLPYRPHPRSASEDVLKKQTNIRWEYNKQAQEWASLEAASTYMRIGAPSVPRNNAVLSSRVLLFNPDKAQMI